MLLLVSTGEKDKIALFASIEEMKFRRKVVPGDQIVTEVTLLRVSGHAGKVHVVSRVDDEVAAEGQYTFILVPDPAQQQPPGKEI